SRAEPNPTEWRKAARSRELRRNRATLLSLVEHARVEEESVSLLLALSARFRTVKKPSLDPRALESFNRARTQENELQISFLKKVQQAHPDDFRANYILGTALMAGGKPDEAARYFQAVIALRPRLLIGYHHLGMVLRSTAHSGAPERYEEAIAQLRKGL